VNVPLRLEDADAGDDESAGAAAQSIVSYHTDLMPHVEVRVEDGGLDVWRPGRMRMKVWNQDATWSYVVEYQLPGEESSRVGTFPTDRVRP
jgi:hypothetical protein